MKLKNLWPWSKTKESIQDMPLDYGAHYQAVGVPGELQYPTSTLGEILDQTAHRFGDNTAIVYAGTQTTYNELLQKVNRVAAGLFQIGVRPGDHRRLAGRYL